MKTRPINHTGRSDWRYVDSKDSSKPGYLANKFARLRREIEAAAQRDSERGVVAKRHLGKSGMLS